MNPARNGRPHHRCKKRRKLSVSKDQNVERPTFQLNQCRVSKLNDCRLTLMTFSMVLNVRWWISRVGHSRFFQGSMVMISLITLTSISTISIPLALHNQTVEWFALKHVNWVGSLTVKRVELLVCTADETNWKKELSEQASKVLKENIQRY